MNIWNRLLRKKVPESQPVAQSEAPAYKRMFPPNPSFFSVLLSGVFIDERIGLDAQEMNRLVATLPMGLQGQGPMWINLYLSWTLSKIVQEKHGAEFRAQSIAAIQEARVNVDRAETRELLDALSAAFSYWFPVFDMCLAMPSEPDCPPELKDSPPHFVIAYAMLKHSPRGSAFSTDEDAAQLAISNALREALVQRLPRFKRMIEIGAPLEELV